MNSDMASMGVLVAMDSCCYREGEKNYPTILFFFFFFLSAGGQLLGMFVELPG